jgi:hypothetical protein
MILKEFINVRYPNVFSFFSIYVFRSMMKVDNDLAQQKEFPLRMQ